MPIEILRAALKEDRDPFPPSCAGFAAWVEPRSRSPLRELVDHRLLQARHRATLPPPPRPATAARQHRSPSPAQPSPASAPPYGCCRKSTMTLERVTADA